MVVLCAAVVVSSGLAAWFYFELTQIPVCEGGFEETLSCPANTPGFFTLSQWGNGTQVNGSYNYTVVVEPMGELNASQLTVRVYNPSTNSTASLSRVTLYDPFLGVIATYVERGGSWTTSTSASLDVADILVLTSAASLSGEALNVTNPSAHTYETISLH